MTELTEEQMASLPYAQTPATALDVVKEITNVSTLVASIMAAGLRSGGDSRSVTRMITDPTTETGRNVLVLQTRAALALDSLIDDHCREILESLSEAFPSPEVAEKISALLKGETGI